MGLPTKLAAGLAAAFAGPGEKLNLVPMNGNLNKGEWKKMENEWAEALKDNQNVSVKILPKYSGEGARPKSLQVQYRIGEGKVVRLTFKNTPGGK